MLGSLRPNFDFAVAVAGRQSARLRCDLFTTSHAVVYLQTTTCIRVGHALLTIETTIDGLGPLLVEMEHGICCANGLSQLRGTTNRRVHYRFRCITDNRWRL